MVRGACGGLRLGFVTRDFAGLRHLDRPCEKKPAAVTSVADALRETVGPDQARVLERQLLSEYRQPFNMPRAQALLLALRQVLPAVADPVLQRSRTLYAASGAA